MFPGKFINFSEATGGVSWKVFCNINRKVAGLQLYWKEVPTQMFSSEYCEIFNSTYFEEHQLTAASDFLKQLQHSGEQLLLYWLFF